MPGEGGTGGGNGGSQGGGEGGTREERRRRGPQVKRRRRDYSEEASDYTDGLVRKYGSKEQALVILGNELFEGREERRELSEENDQLRAKVPADGSIVLTGSDVANWNAIKAAAEEMKLPADKIGEQMVARAKKAGMLEAAEQKRTLSEKRRAVATAADLDGDVLDPLLDQFGLEVENREIQVQGPDNKLTPKQVAHVKKAGDATAGWEKLSDFIAREGSPLKPFAAALAKKATTTTPATTTAPFPTQTGGTPAGGASSVDAFIAKRNEAANRPNPFSKPTPEKKAG